MADLNALNQKTLKQVSELSERMKNLYADYEQMYKEGFRELTASRNASGGSMEGLEAFYIAVQTVRRNRDVIVSLMKGLKGLRPMGDFRFIEEDVEPQAIQKPRSSSKEPEMTPDLSSLQIEEIEQQPEG